MTKRPTKSSKNLEGVDIISETMIPQAQTASALDDEIAVKAQQGDPDSQEYLLKKYKNLVKKLALPYNIVGGDSQDLIQEGMIGLYKAIRDFDIERGIYFHVFAKTCVNRQIISAVRAASRKKHTPLNNYVSLDASNDEGDELNIEGFFEPDRRDPESIILFKERSEILSAHLKKNLTEKERKVLYLYLENYSYAEIAEKVGISYKGVTSTMQRIKRKLLTRGVNVL